MLLTYQISLVTGLQYLFSKGFEAVKKLQTLPFPVFQMSGYLHVPKQRNIADIDVDDTNDCMSECSTLEGTVVKIYQIGKHRIQLLFYTIM